MIASLLSRPATAVFDPFTGAGAARKVSNAEAAVWGTEMESAVTAAAAGNVQAQTWTGGLVAIEGTRDGQPGMVIGPDAGTHTDPVVGGTVDNVGLYTWWNDPGGWQRIGDLPSQVVRAVNSGAGTADAVQATAASHNTAAYATLFTVNFVAENTGNMFLSINGENSRQLVTNTGAQIPAGYVKAGMSALVQIDSDGKYRFFSYGDASAVQAVVEGVWQAFQTQFFGSRTSNPSTDPLGGALQEGAFYWNSVNKVHRYWDGDSWETFPFATVADGAITMAKIGTGIWDGTNNLLRLGDALHANRTYLDATYTGQNNVLLGENILTQSSDPSAHVIAIGYLTLQNAKKVYGHTMIGFRNGSAIDGTLNGGSLYVTGIGIDCFTSTGYANASTAIGAHNATYKDDVRETFIGGAFAAYNKGTVASSVVIGYQAGGTNTGSHTTDYSYTQSVVIGWQAGKFLGANGNTFVGYNVAGGSPVTGASNVGIGSGAMASLTSGTLNTAVGVNAGISAGTYTNSTAIGYAASATASNHVVLGNSSITSLRCQQTSITALSDLRDKRIAGADGRLPFNALRFINGVTVRWFTWDMRDGSMTTDTPEAGIFAQELDALQTEFGVDLGLVCHLNPNRLQATPHKLLFPMIEAVQQLTAANDDHENRIQALEAELAILKAA